MKIFSAIIFVLTMTTSSLFAGNCAEHNKANLEAMACEAGFTWNETSAECVKDTAWQIPVGHFAQPVYK